jgi:hypothetical protein
LGPMHKLAPRFGRGLRLMALLSLSCSASKSNAPGQMNDPAGQANLLATATDAKIRKELRVQAIQSPGHTSFAESGDALLALLGHQQP